MSTVYKTFFCPDLMTQADAVSIEEVLQASPGIEGNEVDHVAHTVAVTVANTDGLALVEWTLRDAGYPAEAES